jgi:hypothetical protein
MKRISDERLDVIDSHRLRTPTGKMPDGTVPPIYASSDLAEELLQALNTDRRLLNEAEELMVRMASHLRLRVMGQTMNEYAGDMDAWMEKLND